MMTTEEISVRVFQLLNEANDTGRFISGRIDYERNDYSGEDVIIVPHTIDGEGSVRYGQINVNIHVPDILIEAGGHTAYRTDFKRLIEIRSRVIEVLRSHYESGEGWNWTIGRLNPPIKEQNHNEHFVSLALELTVRHQ